jgi:hypothetical protein
MLIDTYIAQLERFARTNNVDLAEACEAAGVAATTLWRWRKGYVTPRLDTTKLLMRTIDKMGNGK